MPIAEVISGVITGIELLRPKEPTPEEQKQKAGVWYRMLQNWVSDVNQDTIVFGSRWVDQLPFSQRGTRERFIQNNITGQSSDTIINTLVGKINDELIKGGFSTVSREVVLSGMGIGGAVSDSSVNTAVSGGLVTDDSAPFATMQDVNESKTFFYVMALVASGALIAWYSFRPKKKRRR